MAVLVYINGSVVLRVDTDMENMEKVYKNAVDKNLVLKITSDDGKTRVVNPSQVSYFEEEDDPAATVPGKHRREAVA